MECTKSNAGTTALNIQNFGIKFENNLFKIALECAKKNVGTLAQHIHKFEIKNENFLTIIVLECAKLNGLELAEHAREVTENIQNFGIKTESTLFTLAMTCAKWNAAATALNIHKFGIQTEALLTEIAMECIKREAAATALNIQNFGIKTESTAFTLAMECSKFNAAAIAQNIQKFGIITEKFLAAIAMEGVKRNVVATLENFKNFGIKNESYLFKIAMMSPKRNVLCTIKFINNFGIKTEKFLAAIALECAKYNALALILYIKSFNIKTEEFLAAIALECIKQDELTLHKIVTLGIKNEKYLTSIALKCTKHTKSIPLFIDQFHIKNQNALFKIALQCARQDWGITLNHIQNFNIKDLHMLLKVLLECMNQSDEYCAIYSYNIHHSVILDNLVKCNNIINGTKENDNFKLFKYIKNIITELACSNNSKLILKNKLDEIASLDLHPQTRSIRWLLHSLVYMATAESHDVDWMLKNGLWGELGNLRRPELRHQLMPALFNLVSSENKNEWNSYISAMKDKKSRLKLLAMTIPLDLSKNLSTLNIDKHSSLNDVHKMTTFLEATYLLSVAKNLSPEQKSSVFGKIIPIKQNQESDNDYQKKLIKNATATKGLLQFNNFRWVESTQDLEPLFRECFEELIPLKGYKGDTAAKYDEIFAVSRNPLGLLTYAAGLKTLNDPKATDCLGEFVSSVFRGDFNETRYNLATHPHLAKIEEKHSDILKMWQEGVQVNFESRHSKNVASLKDWFFTNLIVEKRLGDEETEFLDQYLKAQSYEDSKLIYEELVRNLKELMVGKNKKEVEDDPSCVNLKLQLEFIKLAKGEDKTILSYFSEIQRLLSLKVETKPFADDIKVALQSFEESKNTAKAQFQPHLTDNPIDWLQCGTDVDKSCLILNGEPINNRGLLGCMMDGKNHLIVIKDAQGKITARAFLSLLWDGEKPVLFREYFYSIPNSAKECEALNHLAIQFAEKLNIPLTIPFGGGTDYGTPLHALGGPAPYETSDAAGGIQLNGRYTIAKAQILHIPQKYNQLYS